MIFKKMPIMVAISQAIDEENHENWSDFPRLEEITLTKKEGIELQEEILEHNNTMQTFPYVWRGVKIDVLTA